MISVADQKVTFLLEWPNTNCSHLFALVIIGGVGGVIAVICGVLIVAVPVGIMCYRAHRKGVNKYLYLHC